MKLKTEDKAAEVTLQQCKNQVAKEAGHKDWATLKSEYHEVSDYFHNKVAELYASQVSASKDREIEELKEWKRQMLQIWSPVLDWMQGSSNLKPGQDISKECLRRCQEFESQSKTIEELKNILREALEWVEQTKDVRSCDTEAKIKEALNS